MDYIEERKASILARYNAGMSLRRISEIYGVTTHDVQDVVEAMTRTKQEDNHPIHFEHHGSGNGAIAPVKYWDAFPFEAKNLARSVAETFGLPVVALFEKGGRSRKEQLARGCFFKTLNAQLEWTYARIGSASGRSGSAVKIAIDQYLKSIDGICSGLSGTPHPRVRRSEF